MLERPTKALPQRGAKKARAPRRRPLTTTCAALLEAGSDRKLRKLIYGLLAIGTTFELARSLFGSRVGITGPQFTILTAIADLSCEQGIRPSELAEALSVNKSFISNECAKLIRTGLVERRPDLNDARRAWLTLTEKGFKDLRRLTSVVRRANDFCFRSLSRTDFQRLCKMVDALVVDSDLALKALKTNKNRLTAA